jgi:8-oxo-dGTP diphosphatase
MWIFRKKRAGRSSREIEVTCAVIASDREVLAVRRSETMPHPLKWEFPGGKLREGESPEKCIIREIREELGIEIKVERLLPAVHQRYDTHAIKLLPFICSIRKGKITLSEHGEYRWIPFGELEEVDWLEADLQVVAMVMDRLC